MKDKSEVKKIGFHFENCEYFTIKRKYFGEFYLGDVGFDISRIACNSIRKNWHANTVVLEIYQEGNKAYAPFGQEVDDETETYYTNYDGNEENINQKSVISELGNLYLVIEEGKEIADYFDMQDRNNQSVMDFEKDMCFRIDERRKRRIKS